MSNDFGADLAALGELFNQTKAQSEIAIDDGVYQFAVESAELTTTPSKEDPNIKVPTVLMKFSCLTKPYEGQVVPTWDRLNKKESVSFFKEKMLRLGVNPSTLNIETLEVDLKKVVGAICTCAIVNKPAPQGNRTFTNLFVRTLDAPPKN